MCGLVVGTNSSAYLRMSIEAAKLPDHCVHDKQRFPQDQLENTNIHGVNKASKISKLGETEMDSKVSVGMVRIRVKNDQVEENIS